MKISIEQKEHVIAAQREMNQELAGKIAEVVEVFQGKTGVGVRSVYVGLINVATIEDARAHYIVSGVSTDIEV